MLAKVRCPRDETERREVGGTLVRFRIDVCPRCHGTWLDRGELNKLTSDAALESMIRDFATASRNPLACVRDGGPMRRRVLQDVEVDVCGSCGGVWVDKGELDEVEEAAQAIRAEGGRARPMIAGMNSRDYALLTWVAPDTLERLRREERKP